MRMAQNQPTGGVQLRALLIGLAVLLMSAAAGYALTLDLPAILVLAAPLALVVAWLLFNHPDLGAIVLLGITWGFISEIGVKYHGIPSTAKPLAGLLTLALVIRRFTGHKTPLVSDQTTWWMLGYWLVIGAGFWYAPFPNAIDPYFFDFGKELLTFLLIINFITTTKRFEQGMYVLLAVVAVIGLVTLYQELAGTHKTNIYGGLARIKMAFITDEVGNRPRAGGTTGEPNAFGQQMLVLLPVALWAATHVKKVSIRTLGVLAAIGAIAGVVLSFSRGAYIGLVIVFALYALHIKLNPRYAVLAVLLVVGLIRVAPPEFTARFGTLGNLVPGSDSGGVQSEGSFRGRSAEMLMAAYMFADNPLIGVGSGNYRKLYPTYIREHGAPVDDEERNAHSFYLEVLAEHGLIGFVVWGGILSLGMMRLLQARRLFLASENQRMAELAAALAIGYTGYLFTAIFLHGAYPFLLWTQIGMAVALYAVARRVAAGEEHELPPTVVIDTPVAAPAVKG